MRCKGMQQKLLGVVMPKVDIAHLLLVRTVPLALQVLAKTSAAIYDCLITLVSIQCILHSVYTTAARKDRI